MTTKTFDTLAVFSAHSGILLCKFDEMHELIEFVLKRPVWTHELASKEVWSDIRTALERALPGMLDDYEKPPTKDDFYPGDTDIFKAAVKSYCDGLVARWGERTTINDEELSDPQPESEIYEISAFGEGRVGTTLDHRTAVELARFLRDQAKRNLNPMIHDQYHKFADLLDPEPKVQGLIEDILDRNRDLTGLEKTRLIMRAVWGEIESLPTVKHDYTTSMSISINDLAWLFGQDRRA